MGLAIAFAGKGGVGKTTLSALAVQWLVERGGSVPCSRWMPIQTPTCTRCPRRDATAPRSAGIREERAPGVEAGVSKQEFLDLQRAVRRWWSEAGYDLIVMGRPEGQRLLLLREQRPARSAAERLARQLPEHRDRQRGGPGAHLAPHAAAPWIICFLVSDSTRCAACAPPDASPRLPNEVGLARQVRAGSSSIVLPDGVLPA